MRLLVLFAITLFPFTSFAQEAKPTPGQFDYYILAMSYMNDFCLSHPQKKECKAPLDQPEMVLHGLWPNVTGDTHHKYQYCSEVTEAQLGNDWCKAETDVRPNMTDRGFASLSAVMPGAQSCLYNHEWYAHGACSGMSVADYFATSARLAKKVRKLSALKTLLKDNYGKEISRTDLQIALFHDLGLPAIRSVTMDCRRSGGKAFLSEIRLTLVKDELAAFPKTRSFGKTEPLKLKNGDTKRDVGSCPATGIVVSSAQASAPPASDTPKPEGFVENPCPCSKFPGKSFCKATGFALNTDGSVTTYRNDKKPTVTAGNYKSVQEFLDQKVCK